MKIMKRNSNGHEAAKWLCFGYSLCLSDTVWLAMNEPLNQRNVLKIANNWVTYKLQGTVGKHIQHVSGCTMNPLKCRHSYTSYN